MASFLKRNIIAFLVLGLIYTIGASAVTPTPTPTPTQTPNSSGLTDKQLSAVMGIITNFILSDNSTPSPNKQELAIEKISKYADSSNDAPTVQDYIDAGVTGVTSANLSDVNQAVKDTSGTSVDTVSEIQDLVNQINNLSTANNKAILGPLVGSTVKVFDLNNINKELITSKTDSKGEFELNNLNQLKNDTYYLISVFGGEDIDANGDGIIDDVATENKGTIYGLITGSNIKSNQINITAISDIAWQYIKNDAYKISFNDINRRLSDIANILFSKDITNDGKINELDLLSFNPQRDEHKKSLNFDYEIFFKVDNSGDSIISSYHENKSEKLKLLLDLYFGNRLSFFTAKDTRSKDIRIKVTSFGKGSYSSSTGDIKYNSENDTGNKDFSFYTKTNSSIIITAVPHTDTEILSWTGCDSISTDKLKCTVSLMRDKHISLSFGYKDTKIVSNVIDLSRAKVTLDNDTNLSVIINHGDNELVDKMAILAIGDYVVGKSENGFLRKITGIVKVSDYKYLLTTIEASLDKIIKQGTGVFSKNMTNDDVSSKLSSQQKLNKKSSKVQVTTPATVVEVKEKSILFSDIEGVELVRPSNLNDTTFTIKIGKPYSKKDKTNKKLSEGIGGSTSGTVALYTKNGVDIVKAKGEIKLNIKIDMGVSYGIFSGLEHFKLIPEINADEKLEIFIEDEIDFIQKEIKLGTINFKTLTFFVGPIPVYVTPGLDIFVGLDGKVNAKVSTGIELKQQIRAGVIYNKNAGVNLIGEFNPSWNFIEPKAEVTYEVLTFIKPELKVLLYGVTGPSLPFRGYLKLKTDLVNADVNKNTWKNDKCIGGFDNTAWLGIDCETKWNVEVNTGKSKIGKLVSKHLKKLETSQQLFKKEWLLTRWQIGGSCDTTKTPPKLKVVGQNIKETAVVNSTNKLIYDYKISNIGGTELEWEISYLDDNIISISKKTGKLDVNKSEIVKITLDTSTLSIGKYSNTINFTNKNEVGLLEDDLSGNTKREVSIRVIPEKISEPSNFNAELFKPTIVKLTWDYPSSEPNLHLLKGYRIFISTDQSNWEALVVVNDVNIKSYLVPNLLTDTTYYFKIDAYTDNVNSSTVETSIKVPEIEPEGDCRGHFTGALIADQFKTSWLSEVYVADQYSEYVGAGRYPDNREAFPKAVSNTFDGIAIDKGTKVTIYSGKNFTGKILYEKIGPAIINNGIWKNNSEVSRVMENWKEPLQTNYPQSVREWSSTNMHNWSYGSLILECGY